MCDLADYEVEPVNPLTGDLLAQGVPTREVARELVGFETQSGLPWPAASHQT
jgi:hypothetical protein